MQIYYEFFISAAISSPKMTRDSNELSVYCTMAKLEVTFYILNFECWLTILYETEIKCKIKNLTF